MADCASPFLAVTAHKEPTMRPTAASVSVTLAKVSAWTLLDSAFFICLDFFKTSCAKSVPDSSQSCKISSVGLNLHRMASNAKLNPAFSGEFP